MQRKSIRPFSFVTLAPIWQEHGAYNTTKLGTFRAYVEFNFDDQSINTDYEFNVVETTITIEGILKLIYTQCGNFICEQGEIEDCPGDCRRKIR